MIQLMKNILQKIIKYLCIHKLTTLYKSFPEDGK